MLQISQLNREKGGIPPMHKISRLLYTVFLLLMTNVQFANGQETDRNIIVAIVEEVKIKYKDVQVTPQEALFRYKLSKGRGPSTEPEMMEMEQLRRHEEVERLAEKIRGIIFRKQKARFGIEVTEAELAERWSILTKGVDLSAAAEQRRQMIEPLLMALKAVYEKGEDKDTVYKNLLANRMTLQEWEIQLRYYRTRKRRKILEDALKQRTADLRKPDEGIRALLVREKMNEAIDREIAKTDPQFAEYKTLLEKDPKNEKLHQFDPNYLDFKRWTWWQEQYRKAKIEIKNQQFKDVFQILTLSDKEEKT